MVTVREARSGDARALGEVHVRAWQRAYRGGLMPDAYLDGLSVDDRAGMWEQALARAPRPRSARLAAEDAQGRVIGFIVVGPAEGDPDAGEGEVYALNVLPEVWGQGGGGALLAAGTERLRDAGFTTAVLWVHPDNARACGFYEAAGWHRDAAKRRQEVLGVEVPEVRYRRSLAEG
jgi:ribosomal protein S18 acetylase RimI-like enzyme